jgi:hypothetical protein
MTQWRIAYQTEYGIDADGRTIWHTNKPVPVSAGESIDSARYRFDSIFRHCFGNTIAYRITTILKRGH